MSSDIQVKVRDISFDYIFKKKTHHERGFDF